METKLIELLKICIEKELDFSYSQTGTCTISKLGKKDTWEIYQVAYFFHHDEIESNLKNINELIEKVKNYKK